jgi:hypothetical protein
MKQKRGNVPVVPVPDVEESGRNAKLFEMALLVAVDGQHQLNFWPLISLRICRSVLTVFEHGYLQVFGPLIGRRPMKHALTR